MKGSNKTNKVTDVVSMLTKSGTTITKLAERFQRQIKKEKRYLIAQEAARKKPKVREALEKIAKDQEKKKAAQAPSAHDESKPAKKTESVSKAQPNARKEDSSAEQNGLEVQEIPDASQQQLQLNLPKPPRNSEQTGKKSKDATRSDEIRQQQLCQENAEPIEIESEDEERKGGLISEVKDLSKRMLKDEKRTKILTEKFEKLMGTMSDKPPPLQAGLTARKAAHTAATGAATAEQLNEEQRKETTTADAEEDDALLNSEPRKKVKKLSEYDPLERRRPSVPEKKGDSESQPVLRDKSE